VRAVALHEPGGELSLVELPVPEPGPGEVLVRVWASSINPIDVRVSTGNYPWGKYEYPVVPGYDVAGTVAALGPGVGRFAVGDDVVGCWSRRRYHDGAWAEYLTVPEHGFLAPLPAGLDFEAAAALPLAGLTALLVVEAVAPLAGETVLVVGAGGAIGRYVV
jgi:NADPH:quinone reductase